MADNKEKLEKERRVSEEYDKIKRSFGELNEVNMSVVEGLIRRAAFMRITLEDMEEDLMMNGPVELFTQSEKTKPYERERPVARLYNTMNGNYQKIIRELASHLPKDVQERFDSPQDIMNSFIERRGE